MVSSSGSYPGGRRFESCLSQPKKSLLYARAKAYNRAKPALVMLVNLGGH